MIIRFSSIGDIIVTSPVVRCVKQQTKAELHVLTKAQFAALYRGNPFIDRIFELPKSKKSESEIIDQLKLEDYDLIIDLHKSLRSIYFVWKLNKPSINYNKINIEKWIHTKVSNRFSLPQKHLVDRYFDSLSKIGIVNDGKGLDYFISPTFSPELDLVQITKSKYIIGVLGSAHNTKMIPAEKWRNLFSKHGHKFVLLGGEKEREMGEQLEKEFSNVQSFAGKTTIDGSAFLILYSQLVISGDTGMMHLAAALKKPILSVWGNTSPSLGMYPYYGKFEIQEWRREVKDLQCRPCSKLGFEACPKKHFKCMNDQLIWQEDVEQFFITS
ncbi:MAG TPA: glycosyltransferase family 9 protein [Saprospiraceae bacterium]|nr:glycosyltransferase family 9 protein [Saprospiraceae bacterium]